MSFDEQEGEEWKGESEEQQDPESLVLKKSGELFGVPLMTQDFAAWDFEHRNCDLDFEPLFVLIRENSRVPEYRGMIITCKKHKICFHKAP